jgi:hypothetical protein
MPVLLPQLLAPDFQLAHDSIEMARLLDCTGLDARGVFISQS